MLLSACSARVHSARFDGPLLLRRAAQLPLEPGPDFGFGRERERFAPRVARLSRFAPAGVGIPQQLVAEGGAAVSPDALAEVAFGLFETAEFEVSPAQSLQDGSVGRERVGGPPEQVEGFREALV